MARPTDPAKLAALRARQAINSANYRARKKVVASGRVAPADPAIVARAQRAAQSIRERRADLISSLPDVRNPKVRLRAGEVTERAAPPRSTRKGQMEQAAKIRAQENAQRIAVLGRAKKAQILTELERDPDGRLHDTMTPEQRRDFQRYSEAIARGSQQSVALLFGYAGGQGLYNAAIERIKASPESRDVEEGLAMLSLLAEQAARAAQMYSPAQIGRITV